MNDNESVRHFIDNKSIPNNTVILYYNDHENLNLFSEGKKEWKHDLMWGYLGNRYCLLPISPLDIYVVERVGRLIMTWFIKNCLSKTTYPPLVEYPSFMRESLAALNLECISMFENNQAKLVRPPGENEIIKIKELARKRKKTLESQGKAKEHERGLIDEFLICLEERSKQITDGLWFCPTCFEMDGHFEPQDSDCFTYKCFICETRWGTEKCTSCGETVTFIRIKKLEDVLLAQHNEDKLEPSVDNLLGRDFTVLPILDENRKLGWKCPRCGSKI
jgi:hypothetical protein